MCMNYGFYTLCDNFAAAERYSWWFGAVLLLNVRIETDFC